MPTPNFSPTAVEPVKVKQETIVLNSLTENLLRSSDEMPNISAEKQCHYGPFKYKLQPFQKKLHIFLYIFISVSNCKSSSMTWSVFRQ